MKKLIGIVVLGLLLCVNSYADEIILECKDEYYDTTKILDLLIFKKEGNIWTLKSSVNNDFFTEGVQTENGQDVLIDISKAQIRFVLKKINYEKILEINRYTGQMFTTFKKANGEISLGMGECVNAKQKF